MSYKRKWLQSEKLHLVILNFFTQWPVWQVYSNWNMFAYCMLVIQRKHAENTVITDESISSIKEQKRDAYVIVLPEFLDFYLFL